MRNKEIRVERVNMACRGWKSLEEMNGKKKRGSFERGAGKGRERKRGGRGINKNLFLLFVYFYKITFLYFQFECSHDYSS